MWPSSGRSISATWRRRKSSKNEPAGNLRRPQSLCHPARSAGGHALSLCGPDNRHAAGLVERLAAAGWSRPIVGPHGSGKSTLLATLLPLIESSGRRPRLIALHDGQRRLPERLDRKAAPAEPAIIVVDGFEQLARLASLAIDPQVPAKGLGIVGNGPSLRRLADDFPNLHDPPVGAGNRGGICAEADGRSSRAKSRPASSCMAGNLRELLFDCYDLYRRRTSGQQSQPGGQGEPENS